VLELYERQALTPDDIVAHVDGLVELLTVDPKAPPPVVLVDSGGPIGQRVHAKLREAAATRGWRLYAVNVAGPPWRQKVQYHRHRDELWGNARDWVMQEGG